MLVDPFTDDLSFRGMRSQVRRCQCMGASERLVDVFDCGAHFHRRPVSIQAVRDPRVGSSDTEGTKYLLLNPEARRTIEV